MSLFFNFMVTASLVTGAVILTKHSMKISNKHTCTQCKNSHHKEIIKEKEIVEVVKDSKTIVQCLFYDPDQNLVEKILYAENIDHAKELAKKVMTHSVQLAIEKGGFDEEDEYDVMNTAIELGENHNGGLIYNHLGMLRTQIMIKHGVLENVEGSNLEEVFSFMDELLERFDF